MDVKRWLQNKDGVDLWRLPELQKAALVAFVPLVYYACIIRPHFTYGDGPELLTAATQLGISHPSGYPLFTMLGFLPAHLPGISPHYHVAFLLSALPSALAAALIYLLLRRLEVTWPVAVLSGWLWAFSSEVVYLATRIEVYALHCMFIAATLYAFTRFAKGDGHRWGYATVGSVCLALTNHLTSVFLVVPVTLGLFVVDRKWLLQPKTILRLLGLSVAGASVYLYFPLAAMANTGDRVTWNDPQTLDRFIFHVTGAEYAIFRTTSRFQKSFNQFASSIDRTFFQGAQIVFWFGVLEAFLRSKITTIVMLLFFGSFVAYIGTYNINDISTYFTGLYLVTVVMIALAVDWLIKVRLPGDSLWADRGRWLAAALAVVWIANMGVKAWGAHYREATAQDMSEQVYAGLKAPAIIFTSVDGHSFPLWYQRYVNHPDDQVIPIDQVMFGLANKQWYRDFHRDNFDWVVWPPDEVATRSGWEQWMVDNNPNVNFYAMLHNPWRSPKSYAVNRGWYFEIVRGSEGRQERASHRLRHVYTSKFRRYRGASYMTESRTHYTSGEERIACVTEWSKHEDLDADWRFVGPQGQEITFKPHPIPKNSNMSWEFLRPEDQVKGEWRCEVREAREPLIVTRFTLE